MTSTMAGYEAFLANNVSTISSIESTLRSLTWFLPGRFKDAELASEALSTLLNVTSMYHDNLLGAIARNSAKPTIPPSLHFRYTQAWVEKDVRYKWIARTLEILRYAQLVIEMGMKRNFPHKHRWRGIVFLEAIKAIFRLSLLHITKRPLAHPPMPEREFDPTTMPPAKVQAGSSSLQEGGGNSIHSLFKNITNVRSGSVVEDYLLPKALSTSSVRPSVTLMSPLASPREWASEVIYVLRPLIYATLYVSNRKSRRPLINILVLEMLSRFLRRTPPPSAALERSEYARRDRDMLWYLLRGSIWEDFTRPKLEVVAQKASRAPVVGLIGALLEDWIPLIDEYYYYTAP